MDESGRQAVPRKISKSSAYTQKTTLSLVSVLDYGEGLLHIPVQRRGHGPRGQLPWCCREAWPGAPTLEDRCGLTELSALTACGSREAGEMLVVALGANVHLGTA